VALGQRLRSLKTKGSEFGTRLGHNIAAEQTLDWSLNSDTLLFSDVGVVIMASL